MKSLHEIEVRGVLTLEEYEGLKNFLDTNFHKREVDNRETVFYEIPNGTLKVSKKLSKNTAKIAFKIGDIVSSKSQTEYEQNVPFQDSNNYIILLEKLMSHLGYDSVQYTKQDRINYWIDGYEFAIKWSEDLGYHYEAETTVTQLEQVGSERAKLIDYVTELGLPILSEDDFKALGKKATERHKKLNEKRSLNI